MRDLNKIAAECMQELDAIGIQYGKNIDWSINTRAKKRWGLCKKTSTGFHISISERLLQDNVPINSIKNTIHHELLHTCKEAMNHQYEWKRLAAQVNTHYGYNVKRITSAKEKGIEIIEKVEKEKTPARTQIKPKVQNFKYKFVCIGCGAEVNRIRASKFTQHPERYHCSTCGGRFERVF